MVTQRPSTTAGRDTFVYGEITGLPANSAPSLINRSYTISAEVEVKAGDEGMLNTNGGRFGGYGFYLRKGKPVFTWNLIDLERVKWEGQDALAAGKHTLSFEFTYEGPGPGKGGTGVLKVDGKAVATKKMARTIPFTLQWDETFDVGSDNRHSGGRQGLPVPVRLHRQAGETDRQDRAEPDAAAAEEGDREEDRRARLSCRGRGWSRVRPSGASASLHSRTGGRHAPVHAEGGPDAMGARRVPAFCRAGRPARRPRRAVAVVERRPREEGDSRSRSCDHRQGQPEVRAARGTDRDLR